MGLQKATMKWHLAAGLHSASSPQATSNLSCGLLAWHLPRSVEPTGSIHGQRWEVATEDGEERSASVAVAEQPQPGCMLQGEIAGADMG